MGNIIFLSSSSWTFLRFLRWNNFLRVLSVTPTLFLVILWTKASAILAGDWFLELWSNIFREKVSSIPNNYLDKNVILISKQYYYPALLPYHQQPYSKGQKLRNGESYSKFWFPASRKKTRTVLIFFPYFVGYTIDLSICCLERIVDFIHFLLISWQIERNIRVLAYHRSFQFILLGLNNSQYLNLILKLFHLVFKSNLDTALHDALVFWFFQSHIFNLQIFDLLL